jgi:3-oxoacyl-[acyl-carrier protein] reductase
MLDWPADRSLPAPFYSSLRDRVVVVTGGSRGLGREMAWALAARGARVAITARQDGPGLREAARVLEQRAGPGRSLALAADVDAVEACKRAVEQVRQAFDRIDVLVNNAALGMRLISESYIESPPRFWEADPDAWHAILRTNVSGAFNMARATVPGMVAQRFGKVINISTSSGVLTRRGMSPYGASKAALEALSVSWSQDLLGTGVDVNVLLPGGPADTDILPDSRRARGGLLPAAVMVPGILWLCADESNGRTGGRYVAARWDPALPCAEAAMRASEPLILGPRPA